MREVLDQLPDAIRQSRYLLFSMALSLLFCLLTSCVLYIISSFILITFLVYGLFIGVLWRLLYHYKLACQKALESECALDIKEACRRQKAVLKFFGLIVLLAMVLGSLILLFIFGFLLIFALA